jgi:hypothetical protein
VTYEQLIQPHVEQTREAAAKREQVLLIQDTTEADYQQHPTTTGLGPIGNGSHQGFLLQSVLAILPDTREVLGLAHQEPFLRQPVRHRRNQVATRATRAGVASVGAKSAGHRRTSSRSSMDSHRRSLQ